MGPEVTAMKKEVHDLVEAVRGLGLVLTGKPAPKCVRITGDPTDFAGRLERVQLALEALDASGSLAEGSEPPSPRDDPERLREALDRVIRLYQVRGGNLDDLDAIVRDSLGLEPGEEEARRKKEHATLPAFAPSRLKRRRGGYKLRLNLFPDRPGEASLNDLRRIAFDVDRTRASLGASAPNSEVAHARVMRKVPPPPPGTGMIR